MPEGFLDARAGLAGKVALLIGGGGGLGNACAVDLAGCGVDVGLLDRDRTLLDATTEQCRAAGVRVVPVVGDARDPDVLAGFFATADAELGRLDVLVNVVGGTFRAPFVETTPNGWDALTRANFTWLLHSTQLAIPRLEAAGGGSIIQITTVEAHRAAPNYAVYAGLKAAVTNFSRSLAVELAPLGIRVNTIAPDGVPTEAMTAITPVDGSGADRARISVPMGRRGTYQDVGGCAIFLASDLSRFVTGTSLHPDGGVLASSGWSNWPGAGFLNAPPPDVVRSQSSSPPQ